MLTMTKYKQKGLTTYNKKTIGRDSGRTLLHFKREQS